GSGKLVLSGANTYSGTTDIASGTVALGADNAIKSGNDIQLAGGGVFDLAGHAQTLRNANITSNIIGGGTITSSAAGGVLTLNTTNTNQFANLQFTGQL